MITAFVKSNSQHRRYFSFNEVIDFLKKLSDEGKLAEGTMWFSELNWFADTCELDNAPHITVVER